MADPNPYATDEYLKDRSLDVTSVGYPPRLCAEKGHIGWDYIVGDMEVSCRCGYFIYPLGSAKQVAPLPKDNEDD